MTTVFLAERQSDRQKVAFKQLQPVIAVDEKLVERFTRGAEIMAKLRHPHIAEVYEHFQEGDSHFQVEEFLPGGSLADYLEAHPGPAPEKLALTWCRQALLGVDHAHQQGVLHRDLKPGNLMLDAKGDVKITDFGIAKVIGNRRLTVAGTELGTPDYMSPEQISNPAEVTHLTDIYSMGVVLFQLLTGRLPFEFGGPDSQNDFEIRRAVVQDSVPPIRKLNPAVSRRLQGIVMKALNKMPKHRFGGGREFADQIEQYLESTEIRSKPRDWRQTATAGAAALLMFTGGFWSGRRSALNNDLVPQTRAGNVIPGVQLGAGTQASVTDPNLDKACEKLLQSSAALDQARAKNREAREFMEGVTRDQTGVDAAFKESEQLLQSMNDELKRLRARLALAPAAERHDLQVQVDQTQARITELLARRQAANEKSTRVRNSTSLALTNRSRAEQAEEREMKAFAGAAEEWLKLNSSQPCRATSK